MTKYDVNTDEDLFQPGSDGNVLLNFLNITDKEEMEETETGLLYKLYEKVFTSDELPSGAFTFADIAEWHRLWLGNVYSWAGKIRSVSMSKAGFPFMAPLQIQRHIDTFETSYLVPFNEMTETDIDKEEFISLLAESHVEFILIHPFREGNGRISRLLLDYMSQEAGYGLLDYSLWDTHKDYYFRSIQAGLNGDYDHMKILVRDIIK
jgi:cell filamentation protein